MGMLCDRLRSAQYTKRQSSGPIFLRGIPGAVDKICTCNACNYVKKLDSGKITHPTTLQTTEGKTMAPVPMADAKEGSNPVEKPGKPVKSKQASAVKALPEFFEARIKKFEELQKEQAEERIQKGGHPIKYALESF